MINYYLSSSGIQFKLDIRDTKGSAETALEGLTTFHKQGINTVIVPMSSEECINVPDYTNENSMLLISPSATAPELSLRDNFFRLAVTDASVVDGITASMKNTYGFEGVIAVYLDDTYGRGYLEELETRAADKGMEVKGAVFIPSDNPDYTALADELEGIAASGIISFTTSRIQAVDTAGRTPVFTAWTLHIPAHWNSMINKAPQEKMQGRGTRNEDIHPWT